MVISKPVNVTSTTTPRQVKIAFTQYEKAVRRWGGSSPQAYNAYQRFLLVRERLQTTPR